MSHDDTDAGPEFRGDPYATPAVAAATDARGNAVPDPTANVLALVAAAIRRQDDLRESEARHSREMSTVRAEYEGKLRSAETQRIDAIRAVDVGNVQRAAEVQSGVAAALAAQLAATATAQEGRLAASLEPIQRRIDDLTRAQYEAQGQKTQVVEARTAFSATAAISIGVAGLVLTAIIIAIGIYAAFHK